MFQHQLRDTGSHADRPSSSSPSSLPSPSSRPQLQPPPPPSLASHSNPFLFEPVQPSNVASHPIARRAPNRDSPDGKRPFRPNPVLQRAEDARDRRRQLFLKRLQDHREEKAMQARGGEDEMMRLIYLSEKNRWETSQERAALAASSWQAPLDTVASELQLSSQEPPGISDFDAAMVDAMAEMEEEEIQGILCDFESQCHQSYQQARSTTEPPKICRNCGSDEILMGQSEVMCFNCGVICEE
ncbi:hypothetical protein Dda_6474 [Drechslerella dactyloides]|uniref:Uncharacterized protein n=1 Tax=Drechslerella dactyloides TaxID=74499 RepID=A0AAD6ITN2_DREDA|nr:hypothetical protein Dda_6474 [Drechslerella dactyloides]